MTPPAVTPKTTVQSRSEPQQPRKFTFEEYCAYEDGTDNRYELVNGYLRLMTSPAGWHILICEFLVYIFNQLFQKTETPLWAVREVGVRTGGNTSRIVDICVNWEHHWQKRFRSEEKGIFLQDRTPLLVVEVTSTNKKEDYEAKYQEYASIGIPEYWIVNRRREQLRICTLAASGEGYVDREFTKGERLVSKVLPQLELTVDEVLNPPTVRALLELEQSRQTALEQRATESEQRATESEQRATESEQRATESEQRATESEQRATESEQRATESEQRATESEQRATESEQRATESEQRATELEAMLARYQAQFGNLADNATD